MPNITVNVDLSIVAVEDGITTQNNIIDKELVFQKDSVVVRYEGFIVVSISPTYLYGGATVNQLLSSSDPTLSKFYLKNNCSSKGQIVKVEYNLPPGAHATDGTFNLDAGDFVFMSGGYQMLRVSPVAPLDIALVEAILIFEN